MSRKSFASICCLVVILVGLGVLRPEVHAQGTIKLGNLVDLTGPTSDQGKDISQARIDAVQYFNAKGGINGKKIELVSVEYTFQPPRAVAAYKKFVEEDKVILVLGYGTPDTEALRPYITKDKVPYLSGPTPATSLTQNRPPTTSPVGSTIRVRFAFSSIT
jgi:branched-chain amino acid transport system substrate-binding protein